MAQSKVEKAKAGVASSFSAVKSAIGIGAEKQTPSRSGGMHAAPDAEAGPKAKSPRKAAAAEAAPEGTERSGDNAVTKDKEFRAKALSEIKPLDPDDMAMSDALRAMEQANDRVKDVKIGTGNMVYQNHEIRVTPAEEREVALLLRKLRSEGAVKETFEVGGDTVVRYGDVKYRLKAGKYKADDLFPEAPVKLDFDRAGLINQLRSTPGVKVSGADQPAADKPTKKASAPKAKKASKLKK